MLPQLPCACATDGGGAFAIALTQVRRHLCLVDQLAHVIARLPETSRIFGRVMNGQRQTTEAYVYRCHSD